MEGRYSGKPVHFFHVVTGENADAAADFKKHYRSGATFLLDPTYATARAYDAMSWPTDVVVDPEGKIAGRWGGLFQDKDRAAAHKLLDDLAAKAPGGPRKGTYCIGGQCFVRTEDQVFELQPAMTSDNAGRVHLVFVRDRGEVGDLHHRVLDGDHWSQPVRVTQSAADDYAPFLCPDPAGGVRLVWCSNSAASGRYDVYTSRFDGGGWSKPEAVTQSPDDAAHPRAAFDTQGNLWVTYYRWIPWGKGQSRDREIFARYHDGKAWSDEVQLSPTDVPNYEDHADPCIAADAGGNVWVAWAWDTHPEEGKWPYPPTFGSTVFTRQLRAGQPPSQLQMVGMRAPSLSAAMRDPKWAFVPEVYCRNDEAWFAFEAHKVGGEHAFAVVPYQPGEGFPAPTELGANRTFVCSPRLVGDGQGRIAAIWSAPAAEHYVVHRADLGSDGSWKEAGAIWSDPAADLRSAVGAFDGKGRLWLAAVRTTLGKSEVVTQAVEPG